MKRSIALLLCLAPSVALALPDGWFLDAAEAEHDGTVEVPVYRGTATMGFPFVAVRGPEPEEDDAELVQLAALTLVSSNLITEAGAEAWGGKVKGKGLERRTVIPELNVGGMVLRDVRFRVIEAFADPDAAAPEAMALSLSALPLECALLNSEGVLRCDAPGSGLAAKVGSPTGYQLPLEGEYHEHGKKVPYIVAGPIVSASWGGQEVPVALETGSFSIQNAHADDTHDRTALGVRVRMADIELAGKAQQRWAGVAAMPWTGLDSDFAGVAGWNVLHGYDIGISPGTMEVALAPIDGAKWSDPNDVLVKMARDTFAYEEKKAAEAEAEGDSEAEDAESDGPDKGDMDAVGRYTDLADALWAAGSSRDALRHYQSAADEAGDNCMPYLQLGRAQLWSGDAEAAVANLQKAGELYDKWWSQDRLLRKDIEAGKSDAEGTFDLAQPGACHEAWGELAAAYLVQGKNEKVADLYEAHLDLDPNLPRYQGLAQLEAGEYAKANGTLRRALNLGARRDAPLRVALGYANAADGNSAVMAAQVDALADSVPSGLADSLLAVEFTRQVEGDAAALAAATVLAEADPRSLPAKLAVALATPEADRAQASKGLVEAATSQLNMLGESVEAYSRLAVAHALAGDSDAATGALKSAANAGALGPEYRVAKALVAQLAGEPAKATEAFAQLRQLHPQFAVLPKAWQAGE